ncbi:MAG TPA: FkbM family methyltransferase [Patescibacteria group bacterium]|nr:FkbM family methyltransferase [Patescibacteria group bacterium]
MPSATLRNFTVSYHDKLEYDTLVNEIFKKNEYYVDLENPEPVIIDCGAHIGLTSLYLLSLYPKAKITAIEPNPANLALLRENISQNGFESQVNILPKALASFEGKVPLFVNPNWGVFSSLKKGGWTGEHAPNSVPIETIKFSSLLDKPIDFVKMDIEGLELEVLREAGPKLKLISHLTLEFHETKKQKVDTLVKLLQQFFKSVEVEKDDRREKDKANQLYLVTAH